MRLLIPLLALLQLASPLAAQYASCDELGYQGGKQQTFNTSFADFDPTAGHLFVGLGLRFGQ